MGSNGKLEVEMELKSSADKFWESIRDSTNLFPKIFPTHYKSIEVLEGDGKSVGSIRLLTYAQGIPGVKFAKEKIDAVDEAGKEVEYSVIDGDVAHFYKHFKAKLVVIPKGEGSSVKWSCEFEKASGDVPDPHLVKDFAVHNFRALDDYLLKA
ncbi:MLP-like protein 423 isoform X2 [Telopea speciosissima]|uniref:MLP-like protein 423 isoform X2 n=1 Tax=Telopea speciosissima TaxID=54955 RepID=UPI001CC39A1F|nr:MLP-like protein 423 isoform X2 [Telopea speciosissima]